MKILLVASVCAVAVFGQAPVPDTDVPVPVEAGLEPIVPRTAVRDLPADVLRDFPNTCFASTACRVFAPGNSWPLTPFCGRATCLVSSDNVTLIERVEDCGLRPKPSPNCTIINQEDLENPFPECCPQYLCEPGYTLEFPTPEELAALASGNAAKPAATTPQTKDKTTTATAPSA